MPWRATFDVPAPIENYDETIPLVEEITHGIPDGLIAHIASPTETGYRVTEVWQSEDHWKRFRTGVLTPLLQRLTGQDSPEQPDPQPFPVHAVRSISTES
jgi:hypothetical protein